MVEEDYDPTFGVDRNKDPPGYVAVPAGTSGLKEGENLGTMREALVEVSVAGERPRYRLRTMKELEDEINRPGATEADKEALGSVKQVLRGFWAVDRRGVDFSPLVGRLTDEERGGV